MLKKTKLILTAIWLSAVSFFSAGWIAYTFMFITGHSKGYAYDLGAEEGVSVIIGMIMLAIWMIALVPAIIWLCLKCYRHKKLFVIIPLAGFVVLFIVGVFSMGFNEFIGYFGVGPTPFR